MMTQAEFSNFPPNQTHGIGARVSLALSILRDVRTQVKRDQEK
jgi:hypothetical protein